MNTASPESMLKKKYNANAYHMVCEAVAVGIICITQVPIQTNLAQMPTNLLPRPWLCELCQIVLY